jgi:hypothetical protein
MWFDRFDVYHVLVNLGIAYVPVAFVMMILYGSGDIISHFQNEGCTMHFYKNDGVDRDNIQAIFFASLGAWAIATKIFGLKFNETIGDILNPTSFFYIASVGLGVTAIVMTQFGVYTGSCASVAADAVAQKINGQIQEMEIYAGIVFSLLLAFALNNMDLVSYISGNDSKTIILLYTNAWSFCAWVLRLLFSVFLVIALVDDGKNSFYLDHGNKLLEATTCLTEVALVDTSTAKFKAFEKIELAEVTYPSGNIKVVPNPTMVALLWSVIAAVSVEGLLRIGEVLPKYVGDAAPPVLKENQLSLMCGAKFMGFYSDVVLSIFVFVLIMSNEIAACPLLDPSDGTVETVYWISIFFITQGFLSGAWKSYTFHSKFGEKAATEAGRVWGQGGYTPMLPGKSAPSVVQVRSVGSEF